MMSDEVNFELRSNFSYKKVKIPEKILNLIKEIREPLLLLQDCKSPWFNSKGYWPPPGIKVLESHYGSDGQLNKNPKEETIDPLNPNAPLECVKGIIALGLQKYIEKIISEPNLKYSLTFRGAFPLIRFFSGAFIETRKNLYQTIDSNICCVLQIEQKCKSWKIQISDTNNDWDEIELKDGEMIIYDQRNCLFGRIDPLEKSTAESTFDKKEEIDFKESLVHQAYSDQMFFYFKYLNIK